MPVYTMTNTETDETEDMVMTIAERDQFLKDNPHFKQELTTPGFVSGHRGVHSRADEGFRDKLREIKKNAGYGNTINIA